MESYVYGRYNKFLRGLPQSPWQEKSDESVSQLICEPLRAALGGTSAKMHASGREDIDVRMLGRGRPFVVEVSGARDGPPPRGAAVTDGDPGPGAAGSAFRVSLPDVEASLNASCLGKVAVRELRWSSRQEYSDLQKKAEEKTKQYRCVCWSERAVSDGRLRDLCRGAPMVIRQGTPVRVLHRRSAATREKQVLALSAERINAHWFILDVTASAGMYIKEFVHGDWGRTLPSMSSLLGGRVDILQLDVLDVVDAGQAGEAAAAADAKRRKTSSGEAGR